MFHNPWKHSGWQCPMAYGCSRLRAACCTCQGTVTRLSQVEGVTEVWLFGKDSFEECPLTMSHYFLSMLITILHLAQNCKCVSMYICSWLVSELFLYSQRSWRVHLIVKAGRQHSAPLPSHRDEGQRCLSERVKEHEGKLWRGDMKDISNKHCQSLCCLLLNIVIKHLLVIRL